MNSIESSTLETAAAFPPLSPAGEGDQDRLTISAAHIQEPVEVNDVFWIH